MNIVILAQQLKAYSQRQLLNAGLARGHHMRLIKASDCYMKVTASPAQVFYQDAPLEAVDAVIPRNTLSHNLYGIVVLKQLEWAGVYSLNSALAIQAAADKLKALQLMARRQIPMPVTGFADSPARAEQLIDLVGGPPLVVKLLDGREGKGTVFADSRGAAASVINAFKQLKANILVQECIKEARGIDIYAFVLGQQVLGAVQTRTSTSSGEPNQATPDAQFIPCALGRAEQKLAIFAVKAMKLNYASVHLLQSQRGPLVLGLDPMPSLEIFDKTLDLNLSDAIICYLEEALKVKAGSKG